MPKYPLNNNQLQADMAALLSETCDSSPEAKGLVNSYRNRERMM